MARDGERQVRGGHAAAVVGDTDQRLAAVGIGDGDATGAGIERKVNDRLTLTTRGSVAHTTATSSNAAQTLYTASTGFTYWLNRFMALTGTAEYENQQSFDRAQTYDAASIRAGVKFQR